jgi:acyl-CoA thioesterase I
LATLRDVHSSPLLAVPSTVLYRRKKMTAIQSPYRWTRPVVAIMMIAGLAGWTGRALAQSVPESCAVASDLARLDLPLTRVAQRLGNGDPVKIIAIGSSSTAGTGASSRAFCYPSRLEAELRTRFPRASITVINRGMAGEEAPQMLARFARDVIAEKPDLVLWQVGSNAVSRGHDVLKVAEVIREGVGQLKAIGADVILIDPQFAPRVIEKADSEQMVALIAAAAKRQNIDLFRRFAVMRYWREVRHVAFARSRCPGRSAFCAAPILGGLHHQHGRT